MKLYKYTCFSESLLIEYALSAVVICVGLFILFDLTDKPVFMIGKRDILPDKLWRIVGDICALSSLLEFTRDMRQSKTLILSTNVDQKLETEFSIAISSIQCYSVLSTIAQALRKMSLKILAY